MIYIKLNRMEFTGKVKDYMQQSSQKMIDETTDPVSF